jgi:hypothetical protein
MQHAARSLERKALILTLVLACQVLAAMFFAIDVAGDIAEAGWAGTCRSNWAPRWPLLRAWWWGPFTCGR